MSNNSLITMALNEIIRLGDESYKLESNMNKHHIEEYSVIDRQNNHTEFQKLMGAQRLWTVAIRESFED